MIVHKFILFVLVIDLWLVQMCRTLVSVEWNFAAKSNSSAAVPLGSTLNLICQVSLGHTHTPVVTGHLKLTSGIVC